MLCHPEEQILSGHVARENRKHVSTVWRWVLRGVKGHRLESFLVGGRRYTTREAVGRFFRT